MLNGIFFTAREIVKNETVPAKHLKINDGHSCFFILTKKFCFDNLTAKEEVHMIKIPLHRPISGIDMPSFSCKSFKNVCSAHVTIHYRLASKKTVQTLNCELLFSVTFWSISSYLASLSTGLSSFDSTFFWSSAFSSSISSGLASVSSRFKCYSAGD